MSNQQNLFLPSFYVYSQIATSVRWRLSGHRQCWRRRWVLCPFCGRRMCTSLHQTFWRDGRCVFHWAAPRLRLPRHSVLTCSCQNQAMNWNIKIRYGEKQLSNLSKGAIDIFELSKTKQWWSKSYGNSHQKLAIVHLKVQLNWELFFIYMKIEKKWKLYCINPRGKCIMSPQEKRKGHWIKISLERLWPEIDILIWSPIPKLTELNSTA